MRLTFGELKVLAHVNAGGTSLTLLPSGGSPSRRRSGFEAALTF